MDSQSKNRRRAFGSLSSGFTRSSAKQSVATPSSKGPLDTGIESSSEEDRNADLFFCLFLRKQLEWAREHQK